MKMGKIKESILDIGIYGYVLTFSHTFFSFFHEGLVGKIMTEEGPKMKYRVMAWGVSNLYDVRGTET